MGLNIQQPGPAYFDSVTAYLKNHNTGASDSIVIETAGASSTVTLKPAGTSRVVVTAAGLVTVSTAVNNYGFFHSDGTRELGTYLSSSLGGLLGTNTNHPVGFFVNAGLPSMLINASGNIGIGTTSPAVRLHVKNASGITTGFQINTNDYASGTTGTLMQIEFGAATGNTTTHFNSYTTGGGAWGNLILQSGGGKVGIGTTSPGKTLSVMGRSLISPSATYHSNAYKLTNGGADYGSAAEPINALSDNAGSYAQLVLKNGDGAGANSPSIGLAVRNSSGNYTLGGVIVAVTDSATAGSETHKLSFRTQTAGAAATTDNMTISGAAIRNKTSIVADSRVDFGAGYADWATASANKKSLTGKNTITLLATADPQYYEIDSSTLIDGGIYYFHALESYSHYIRSSGHSDAFILVATSLTVQYLTGYGFRRMNNV